MQPKPTELIILHISFSSVCILWHRRHQWVIICDLDVYVLPSWYNFTYSVDAKHFPMLIKNDYLIWFEYTDFHIFNSFTSHHRALAYVCWIYFFAKSAATPRLSNNGSDHAEWYISSDFHHYSFIDVNPALPCKLQPERLAVIYWNLYVVLKCYIEKWTDVPETIQIYILQCWATHM